MVTIKPQRVFLLFFVFIVFFGCKTDMNTLVHIFATSNEGGSITPSGTSNVTKGNSLVYLIKSNEGYKILSVKVNKVEIPVSNQLEFTYEFQHVLSDMTIAVVFEPIEFNDYLPLSVGAIYKYNYLSGYSFVYESSIRKGQCTWKIISVSVNQPTTYTVEESFTGYSIYSVDYGSGPLRKDSTHYENQISNFNFEVLENKKIVFPFTMPYWGKSSVTLERFIQSEKTDTCFRFGYVNGVCLRKNVGITSFNYWISGNHHSSVSYSLIEGPNH